MSDLPDVIYLGPEEEADRLWSGAIEARQGAPKSIVSLCESLDLGIRAAEILAIQRLQPIKAQFPATIAIQLDEPEPEVDPLRDAISVPNSLQFTDIVDLLSAEELECVSPGLHRGWEDRRFSCRRSRATAQSVIGVCLKEADRESLLLLAAYRNRLFRSPPPVRLVTADVLGAFENLERLVEGLRGKSPQP